ncbi:MAG: DoxX family membrane protein [Planctomycetota bacterium]
MKDWLLLLLRIATGVGLAYWVGHDKVFDPDARENYARLLQDAGIPAAGILTIMFGVVEFFASLFLAAGFFFRQAAGLLLLACAGSSAIQLLAFDQSASVLFTYRDLHGLGTGYYIVALLLMLVLGAGRISFDAGRRTMQEAE